MKALRTLKENVALRTLKENVFMSKLKDIKLFKAKERAMAYVMLSGTDEDIDAEHQEMNIMEDTFIGNSLDVRQY